MRLAIINFHLQCRQDLSCADDFLRGSGSRPLNYCRIPPIPAHLQDRAVSISCVLLACSNPPSLRNRPLRSGIEWCALDLEFETRKVFLYFCHTFEFCDTGTSKRNIYKSTFYFFLCFFFFFLILTSPSIGHFFHKRDFERVSFFALCRLLLCFANSFRYYCTTNQWLWYVMD